jgi:hypothetical protein
MGIVNNCMKSRSSSMHNLELDKIPSNKIDEYVKDVNKLLND